MKAFFLILLLCGSVVAQTPASFQTSPQQSSLIESLVTRLKLSKEVAWTKFQQHLLVADLKREAAILTALKSQGEKIGLTGNEVSYLFLPQIAASRRAQEELIAGWRFGSPRPKTPPKDLQRDIRPLVTRVSLEMLQEWKALPSQSRNADFQEAATKRIIQAGFSPDVARIAASPLGK
jgi:chorismate mutase-like protein